MVSPIGDTPVVAVTLTVTTWRFRTTGAEAPPRTRWARPACCNSCSGRYAFDVLESLRRQRHELRHAALVVAIELTLAAQRLLLGRGDARDLPDRREDQALTEERDPAAVVDERQAVDREAQPHEPLEEVVRVARVAPEADVADLAAVRRVALPARERCVRGGLADDAHQRDRCAD